jgi:hypothetical protein
MSSERGAEAAANAMSDEEAKEWAGTVVGMCLHMMDRYYEDEP